AHARDRGCVFSPVCTPRRGAAVASLEGKGGTAGMRKVFVICGLIGTAVLPASGREALTLAVSPAIAFAPATVKIRARIEPSADNRCLTVVADGVALYRSSEVQLDGEQAPKTIELSFRDMPGGEYEVYAILSDTMGRQRAIAHQAARVMSQFD